MLNNALSAYAFQLVVAFVVGLFLSGQASADVGDPAQPNLSRVFDRHLLVGSWKGTYPHEGGTVEETAVFAADGSFRFFFAVRDASGQEQREESIIGLWGVSGDIHFTIEFKFIADGQKTDVDRTRDGAYHAYKILELNESVFVYRSLETDATYTLHRYVGGLRSESGQPSGWEPGSADASG